MKIVAPINIEGCEEILDPVLSPPGIRTFLCPWSERFRVAHELVQLFGNVEINGRGRPGEHNEPSHAAIAAGVRRRA
jgi:hypothetical protein